MSLYIQIYLKIYSFVFILQNVLFRIPPIMLFIKIEKNIFHGLILSKLAGINHLTLLNKELLYK